MKPLITVATYLHDASGCEVYQEITGRTFMPMIEPPPHLRNMRATGKGTQNLVLQTRGSKFVKFQEVRIQELADEARPTTSPYAIFNDARCSTSRRNIMIIVPSQKYR